jgi:hypothetical protein
LFVGTPPKNALELLERSGVRYSVLPPFSGYAHPYTPQGIPSTTLLTLSSLHTLQMLGYERVMYFQAGILFQASPDSLLEGDDVFVVRSGTQAPIDTSMFVVQPSWQAFVDLKDMLDNGNFSTTTGWMKYGGIPEWHKAGSGDLVDWSFPGAQLETGLLYYLYFCSGLNSTARIVPPSAWQLYLTGH